MTDDAAHLDFETRSAVDLKKAGLYRYAEDPTTDVWGFCWRIGDDGHVNEWRPGYPDPVQLLEHIAAGGRVVIHNAAFERMVWNWIVRHRYCPHWPPLTIEQQDCTMSRAAALALPQPLDGVAKALHSTHQKNMEGHKLMMKLAKPRAFNPDGTITWWDAPELVQGLMDYCGDDVRAETSIDGMLPPLSGVNRKTWEFDQHINDRGVRFDMPIVERAADLVAYAKKQTDRVMRELTDRAVPKCTNDAKLIAWLNSKGVPCTSLAKGEIEDVVFHASLINDPAAGEAIQLRGAAWKTSTAKYSAMMKCANSDHRIRGLLNWHGAGTGRWAGRLVQPQNFPRVDPDDTFLQLKIAYLHELLSDTSRDIPNVHAMIEAVYGPLEPMQLLSKALRSMIIAADDHRLVGGDFSNIEGRVNAWLAGETWKLGAFQEYDDGTGPDLYKLAYARSFGVDIATVGKGQKRQMGKVMELALGYQGGIGAFLTMGATYGLNPFTLVEPVREATSDEQWYATSLQYKKKGQRQYDLPEAEWITLKILVDNWRAANSKITQSWWNYQDAAVEACGAPGQIIYPDHTRLVYYYFDGRCLWCGLPSGRLLCYVDAELVSEAETRYRDDGTEYTSWRRKVTYWGTDSRTRQWKKQSLYGGLQCENIVQAVSADIMIEAMYRVEEAGYPVILTVHDEIVTEVPEGRKDLNEHHFAQLMAGKSSLYDGLPVSVGAWEDKRYVK